MDKPDYSHWLTKQQAAQAIGVSTKTIEKLAAEGQFEQAYWRRPQTGAKVSVYHPDEVERIRRERNPGAKPFMMPVEEVISSTMDEIKLDENKALLPTGNTLLTALAAVLTPVLRTVSDNSQIRRDRLFLSVAEAVDYSGLPEMHIRRLLKDGKLEGLKTGSGWRIRRADLSISECVRKLNSYNRSTTAGKRSGLNLAIYLSRGVITIVEATLPAKSPIRQAPGKAE